ncbi:MAG TPA: TonB-dependent receptor [Steroidobacteraceae bacterium]|nr:TonB-dependent receptor [Steroidobacteraceae bacterium]
MVRKQQVAAAVRRALVMSAVTTAGFAAPALAQESLGEIVVTGSRIRSANLESTTPVTQVTAADVVTQGVTRIEDLVNQLPQAFAAQNVTVANGASGTATLDLRGLGSPRTLVLIDGRRMPYGGVASSSAAPDINQIPTQMVERVDVLTGGASAVYGSDAVAGVVNFIMKKDFEGVQVTSQYNFFWHENDFGGPGQAKLRDVIAERAAVNPNQYALPDDTVTDGEGKELSLMIGVNSGDGRGNITAYATAYDSKQVLQRDRDYSACSLATAAPTESFACGGSATNHIGTFTDLSTYVFTVDTADSFRPTDALTNPASEDLYNFGPLNHYQRPERRYSIGAMGHYEFGEHADVYTQLMFNDYESVAQVAPGGNFQNTSVINCDNPLLPVNSLADIGCTPELIAAGETVKMIIARRNVEGGGRQEGFANNSFRAVAGVRGAINDGWGYDVSAQYSSVSANESTSNYFAIDRLQRALDVIDVDGVPTCRSVIDLTDTNCVPWNPFVPNGVTQEQLDYIQVNGLQIGRISQEIYNASVNGDLGVHGVKTPWASDGVQVVLGAEYRRDALENTVDALQEANLLSGTGGARIGISGATKVNELFFEGRVPLAQDHAMLESLSFDTAYRYSDYGDGVQTDTYKLGLEWAPVQDVRLRASYQRAVRAANIIELFTAQGLNLFDASATGDPCGANRDPEASDAECIATGVPADRVGSPTLDSPAGQYNFLQGGNAELKPEESDTQSYGIVFTPRFAPGLAISIDYFDIRIDDTISTFGAPNTWTACYANNDPAACARINRDEDGTLWVGNIPYIEDTNINIGSKNTRGYDINASYTGVEIGRFGGLAFNLTGTFLDELTTKPAPGIDLHPDPDVFLDEYDCVGFYSSVCFIPNPEWRHRFRASWQTPWEVDLAATWRYYGSVVGLAQANQPFSKDRIDHELPAESYFDLAANWAVTEKATVTLGINNVLDDNPTLSAAVGTTGNGNTYPQTYDALGRYVFVRASVDF